MILKHRDISIDVRSLGDAVPVLRAMREDVARDRLAVRDLKLRMGWALNLLRSQFSEMSMNRWLEVVGLKRRTAYHTMKLAAELADDAGRFSVAKYRAACAARKSAAAECPEDLTLRQIELDTGLRAGGDLSECAPRCTLSGLTARARRALDVLDECGGDGESVCGVVEPLVESLERVVRGVAE
mgnify:FL=1